MATEIPDNMLRSGDLVDVEYEIRPGANPTLVSMAISQVKKDLWADKRFDYQGSREETRTDKSGLAGEVREIQVVIITVLVRKYPRGDRPTEQQAGILVPIVALVALVAATAWVGTIAYRNHTIYRIAINPNMSDETKQAALGALGKGPGIGGAIAATGGSLVTAAIIIGVLWALSLSKMRGPSD